MNIKIRRAIMYGFIGLFVITAPILVLYSAGYRYDLKRRSLIQTGSLFLEAKDLKKADVYIDNQLYPKQLNEKMFIYNLIPGEYQIRISKDGHYSWEKRLKINSNLTTFAKEIVLFRQTNPVSISDQKITNFQMDPFSQKIAYILPQPGSQEVYAFNLNQKKSELIYRNSSQQKISNITWAPSGKKILIRKDASRYLIINTENTKEIIDLNLISKMTFSNLIWDDFSDDTLWGFAQNKIYKISLSLKTTELYFESANEAAALAPYFWIDGSNVYYFAKSANTQILYRHNLTLKTEEEIYRIAATYKFQFIKSPNDYITLLDSDKQKLVVISKNPPPPEIGFNQKNYQEFTAKAAEWEFVENDQLLFNSDFEVSIYYPKENKVYLVSRYGESLIKAQWYPNLNYIFTQFADKIKIIEIYIENGTRNIIDIVKDVPVTDFSLDEQGRFLYFSGTINNSNGLWQLEVN